MKKILSIMLVLMFLGCSTSPTSGEHYQKGMTAYKKGEYAKAVHHFKKAAVHGNPDAQRKLGDCYDAGIGVKRDIRKAKYWREKASIKK